MSIRLLGAFSLQVDRADVSLPTSAQRLVGILAMRGRLGRSRLAGMLWPDATEQRALASLRTGIWRVNQAAPGLVVSDHGTVHLGLSPAVDLHDLVELSHAVLQDPGTVLTDSSRAVTGDAAAPDAADLLPDWDDPWLDEARERLRQLHLHVMEAEARWYSREGRFGLALDLALAALQTDDLRESAHRLVVEIHLAEGNVADAQRAFEHCRHVLDTELGIEPTEGLCGLLPARSHPSRDREALLA